MGQPGYCCASGQSCAWDDAGHVACCASGSTCSGSAYVGAAAGQGGYEAQAQQGCGGCQGQQGQGQGCGACQQYPQQQTTTVYQPQQQQTDYNNAAGGAVLPIVPVTKATVLESYTTPQYTLPTITTAFSLPTTTTIIGGVVGGAVALTTSVPVGQACGAGGYTTLTQANVGAPVTTVGCYVIFNSGVDGGREKGWGKVGWLGVL
ncbi:MAG: hypothetical protein Q9164_007077, partial [Protoblastenia rupestris]